MKLYEFSEDSVRKAQAAHELGFDTIGKISIPMNQNHSRVHVFMRNTRERVRLDDAFFPEIEADSEIAVTYIIHHKEINASYQKGGSLHHALLKSKHQDLLNKLAKKHIIWIRDVYYPQFDMVPWPQANLAGKAFPICEFVRCFNVQYAEEGWMNSQNTNPGLEEEILKDYFEKGQEGFHFPIDEKILASEEEFNKCLEELYKKFPHLKGDNNESKPIT